MPTPATGPAAADSRVPTSSAVAAMIGDPEAVAHVGATAPPAEAVGEVVRSRKGIPAEGYRLYRVVVPAGPWPDMVVLPQRR